MPRLGRSAALLVLLAAGPASAEVLHEKVTVGVRCEHGLCFADEPRQSGHAPVPVAIDDDGQLVYPPSGGPQPKPGEPIYTPQPETQGAAQVEASGGGPPNVGDQPPERRDLVRSDRETGPEPPGKHFYHEVFNPAVFPFKRMTALDAVVLGDCTPARAGCEEELLQTFDRRLRLLTVSPARASGARDLFWGSAVLDLEPGRWLPLPSVAADVHLLSYHSEPALELEFAVDGADNMFVRSRAGGRHRLTWLSDAPASYFGGELPRGVRLGDEPAELRHAVPPRTAARARLLIEHARIGAERDTPLVDVLGPLVAYFRAFEVGELPPPSDSTYLDLALAQRGVCRHRSYAFAVTAMALGVPVRYIENELHVYVEVYVPRLGWRRINLGGATLDEEVLGADGKTAYTPRGGDPFPQPPSYQKGAQPPPRQLGRRDEGQGSSSAGAPGAGGRGAPGAGGRGASASGGASGSASGSASAAGGRGPVLPYVDLDAVERSAEAEVDHRRARTNIGVELGASSGFRGESVELSGRVRVDGREAGGLPVELYLDGPGGAVRVGATTTAADGSYRATIEVPRNLPLGNHRVVARTPGDDARAPATTRR